MLQIYSLKIGPHQCHNKGNFRLDVGLERKERDFWPVVFQKVALVCEWPNTESVSSVHRCQVLDLSERIK